MTSGMEDRKPKTGSGHQLPKGVRFFGKRKVTFLNGDGTKVQPAKKPNTPKKKK